VRARFRRRQGKFLTRKHISDNRLTKLAYNGTVRRVLSIVLLLAFSLPLISSAVALTAGSEANLPACCRRNGAHHCAMKVGPADGINLSSIPEHCPAYPAVVTQIRHGDLSFQAASLTFAGIVSHPAAELQTQARARVALDRGHQQRGPPTELL
jgi:hypothetical protein